MSFDVFYREEKQLLCGFYDLICVTGPKIFQLNNFTLCTSVVDSDQFLDIFDGYVSNKPHIKFKNSQLNIIILVQLTRFLLY